MSLVELRVWGVHQVLPALGRMATGRAALRRTPGLRFAKLLGTGSARTFTPRDADPHHWAALTVWDDPSYAEAWARGPLVGAWDDASYERLRVRMTPLSARGRWSRQEPFAGTSERGWDGPVAALTRARLRPTRALSFWQAVPPVVADLHDAPGLRLAVGVGEAPIGTQGTFSLWADAAALVDFAYRSPGHRSAVQRTVSERWYAEELFARLAVHEVAGTYEGRTP
jgi:hypothetical protein